MARAQFNVRIDVEVADRLRAEAARRGIGPGELLEELATAHRAEVHPGVWVDLEPALDAALRGLAAARSETPESLLQALVGTAVRDLLRDLAASVPSLDLEELDDALLELLDDEPAAQSGARRAEDGAPLPQGERRRRPRRPVLTEAERAELGALPDDVPRTGADLRAWRRGVGLSVEAVADLCGVSSVAVDLWESRGPLPAPVLLKLARGLPLHFG